MTHTPFTARGVGASPIVRMVLQSSVGDGLREHAIVAGSRGGSQATIRQDLENAGIRATALRLDLAAASPHLQDAEARMRRWRERASSELAIWLHYPLWLVSVAPVVLLGHFATMGRLQPQYAMPLSTSLVVAVWAVFLFLATVRYLGGCHVRSAPRSSRWRNLMKLLPITGPLLDGLDRADRLSKVGAELREGLPLELALLRQGENEPAREVLRGQPAHVALLASERLIGAAPLMQAHVGTHVAEGFERAADGLAVSAIARARAHTRVIVPALVLLSAGAVFWVTARAMAHGVELMVVHCGGIE
ncbi:MAG: hypothetical protein IV100_22865 [Myxococcales bacterium]|nr:hypothetical protein [Myxococcales bacterium]